MKAAKPAEWTGRISGLIISGFVLAFLIGKTMDGLLKNAGDHLLKFIPLFALALAGYVLAWFKPKIGGAFVILGGMLMLDFHLLREDLLTGIAYGVPFIVVGALFMISGQVVKNSKKNI